MSIKRHRDAEYCDLQSIVISVSVALSVHWHISNRPTTCPNFKRFSIPVSVAVARSFVMTMQYYVLPVLWMTWCIYIMWYIRQISTHRYRQRSPGILVIKWQHVLNSLHSPCLRLSATDYGHRKQVIITYCRCVSVFSKFKRSHPQRGC